jgi:lysophospholipase L1-like esterase
VHERARIFYGLCLALCNCRRAQAPLRPPPPAALSASSVVSAAPSAAASPPAQETPTYELETRASAADPNSARRPSDDPSSQGPGEQVVIAAFGDSLTDPRSHGGGYLARLKEHCPEIEIDNFARGGTMVNQMRRRYDELVAASPKRYSHLLLFGGVNDLYSDLTALRSPEKIEADLSYVYGSAKARGLRVIAFTVAPWGGFARYFNPSRAEATRVLNGWIRAQLGHGTVDRVIDAYALLSCGDPTVLCERLRAPFSDGLHFGPPGQRVLGDALQRLAFPRCR